MQMHEYNIQKSVKAQSDYQQRTGSPSFPPTSGNCWNCGNNIYSPIKHEYKDHFTGEVKTRITGITFEEAGSQLVTGCPHCYRSYCD